MKNITLIATSTFGLEACVKRELTNLGFDNLSTQDGSIEFPAELKDIPTLNINLRCASRVLLLIGKFEASTFDELFEKTKALPWGDYIPIDGKFIVTGKSVKSTLYSVPDCQSIVEKAVVEKLKQKYNINWFSKSGAEYKIQVAIHKDVVTFTLDTSGLSLHQRGYRDSAVVAPLKETLACALIELSYWKKDRILLDPCCGSGTIAIEAAMIAKNIAPGLSREFASEKWEIIDQKYWREARKKAHDSIDNDFMSQIYASDMDSDAIAIAQHNANRAGLDGVIKFSNVPFDRVKIKGEYGVMICNPPYAERMGELRDVEKLYKSMGDLFRNHPTWSVYVITSLESFEELYGRKADKKRKLFNGNVKVDYYQYYGTRPPKS